MSPCGTDDLDDLEGAGGGGREKIKFEYRNPKSETIFKTQIKQIRNGKRRSNADGRNQNVSRRDAETQRRKEIFLFFVTVTRE